MQADQKANILLVDDHPENLLTLEAILDNQHYNLIKAHSGKEALRYLLYRDFATILLDVQMPVMDGFETAEIIRQRERSCQTPIIFLTAFSTSEHFIFKGYSLGAVDYLIKPVAPEILLSKVAVFVELFEKTEQIKRQAAQLESCNKKLEWQLQEILRLNGECQMANQELEAFNSSVCHDLRNPLASIKGFSKLLLLQGAKILADSHINYLKNIIMASDRMDRIIEDLMNLSLGARSEMHWETVNLSEIAVAIATALVKSEPHRNVELAIAPEVKACGDGRLLQIVLENLLGNAWKYTRKKSPAKIEFGVTECEGKSAYFVRDNGAGFDMAMSGKLFVPFQRLHAHKDFEGTGIGLATVQRIVHRHGGGIWAKGTVELGAIFWFTLS